MDPLPSDVQSKDDCSRPKRKKHQYNPSRRCWVPNCMYANAKKAYGTRLFTFPRNANVCRQWLQAVGDPELAKTPWSRLTRYRFICKEHFPPEKVTPVKRAAADAVPMFFNDVRPALPEECLKEFDANLPPERKFESSTVPVQPATKHIVSVLKPDVLHEDVESVSETECDLENDYTNDDKHRVLLEDVQNISESVCGLENCINEEQGGDDSRNTVHDQNILENMKKRLCRVCGKEEVSLQPIFEVSGINNGMPLSQMIQLYLPIKIDANDALPSNICSKCLDSLHNWYELYVTSLSAERALHKIFIDKKFQETVKCSTDTVVSVNCSLEDVHVNTSIVRSDDEECSTEDDNGERENNVELLESKITIRELLHNEHSTNYMKDLPKCCYCREFFYCTADCRTHVMECEELPGLCDNCGEEVSHRKNLKEHWTKHHLAVCAPDTMCGNCAKCESFQNSTSFVYEGTQVI